MEEGLKLGGNIELTGFDLLNNNEMVVVKKIVGNYVRKLEGHCSDFNGVKLTMKPLHHTEQKIKKFELHGQVFNGGQVVPASLTEHNVYVGVDAVFKKLMNEISS